MAASMNTAKINVADVLKEFDGSKEEAKLKLAFKQLQPNDFCNFVVESCNGLKPVSFTKADVVIRALYEESFNREAWEVGAIGEIEQPRYTIVSFDQLFHVDLIEKLADNGICDLKDEYKLAFLAILTYLRSVELHVKALSSLRGIRTEEARLAAILAEHLFSPLCPDRQYVLDNRGNGQSLDNRGNGQSLDNRGNCQLLDNRGNGQSLDNRGNGQSLDNKGNGLSLSYRGNGQSLDNRVNGQSLDNRGQSQGRSCPCDQQDCRAVMKYGCTALGSPTIWHGHADIILNENIAVSVLPNPQTCDGEETQSIESDYGDLHAEEGPPPSKYARNYDHALDNDTTNKNIPDRLLSETITNAFVRQNTNSELSGWLIPTFACIGEDITVYLYDPKHDVLLQCDSELPLWDTGYFCIDSIVKIWMFLNFTIFTAKNVGDDYEVEKSNFHCHVKKKLRTYRNITPSHISNVNLISSEAFHKSVLCKYRRFGKRAVKKEN